MRKFSFFNSRFCFIEGIGTVNLERETSSLVHVFWFQMLWSIRTCIYTLWFYLYVNEFPKKKKKNEEGPILVFVEVLSRGLIHCYVRNVFQMDALNMDVIVQDMAH